MSLILDALKQADRERRMTESPGVKLVLDAGAPVSRHRRVRLWLCAALLMVGALCVFLFLPGHRDQEPTIDRPSEKPRRAISRNLDGKEGDPGDMLSRRNVRKAKASPSRVNKTVSDSRPRKPERKTPPVSSRSTLSVRSPGGKAAAVNTPAEIPERPAQSRRGELPERTAVVQPLEKQDVKGKMPEPAPGNVDRAPPLVSELPTDVRGSLQDLVISAHVFDEDPAKRFVFINQRSYRSGDRIGEKGPLLKEITPDGIVIDYGRGQARLQIKRPGLRSE